VPRCLYPRSDPSMRLVRSTEELCNHVRSAGASYRGSRFVALTWSGTAERVRRRTVVRGSASEDAYATMQRCLVVGTNRALEPGRENHAHGENARTLLKRTPDGDAHAATFVNLVFLRIRSSILSEIELYSIAQYCRIFTVHTTQAATDCSMPSSRPVCGSSVFLVATLPQ